jgi:hypothetical protein
MMTIIGLPLHLIAQDLIFLFVAVLILEVDMFLLLMIAGQLGQSVSHQVL